MCESNMNYDIAAETRSPQYGNYYYLFKASLEIALCKCETNGNYYIAASARSPRYMNYKCLGITIKHEFRVRCSPLSNFYYFGTSQQQFIFF